MKAQHEPKLTRMFQARLKQFWLYVHTVRYLQPRQIFFLLVHRLARLGILRAQVDRRVQLDELSAARPEGELTVRPARSSIYLNSTQIHIFGQTYSSKHDSDVWSIQTATPLEQYNLHYFDAVDHVARESEGGPEFARWLVLSWIQACSVGANVSWDPYPTSLRLVNWCFLMVQQSLFAPRVAESVVVQTRWLRRNLEWHLGGNHLLANLKALIVVRLVFPKANLGYSLEWAEKLLRRQLAEQLNADEGHYELSPMYHAIALNDLLEIADVYRCIVGEIPAWLCAPVPGMINWLRHMTFGSGDLASFNDTAQNIAPGVAELEAYAEQVLRGSLAARPVKSAPVAQSRDGQPNVQALESGYVILECKDWKLIADAAKIGPDSLPGHGHADVTSFELAHRGFPLIVHQGTSTYQDQSIRTLQRSSQAHNVTVLGGKDSSAVWGAFRVGRRARPRLLEAERSATIASVVIAHDGYRSFLRPVWLRRMIRLSADALDIEDSFVLRRGLELRSYLHFHPGAQLTRIHQGHEEYLVRFRGQEFALACGVEGDACLCVTTQAETYQYGPVFGPRHPAVRIALQASAGGGCRVWFRIRVVARDSI